MADKIYTAPSWQKGAIKNYRRFLRQIIDYALTGKTVFVSHTYHVTFGACANRVFTQEVGELEHTLWSSGIKTGSFRTGVPPQEAKDMVRNYYLKCGLSEDTLNKAEDFGQFDHKADDNEKENA